MTKRRAKKYDSTRGLIKKLSEKDTLLCTISSLSKKKAENTDEHCVTIDSIRTILINKETTDKVIDCIIHELNRKVIQTNEEIAVCIDNINNNKGELV